MMDADEVQVKIMQDLGAISAIAAGVKEEIGQLLTAREERLVAEMKERSSEKAEAADNTLHHLEHPVRGDVFSEMLTFWVYVIAVVHPKAPAESMVISLEGNVSPSGLPENAPALDLNIRTKAEFKRHFLYSSSASRHLSWVRWQQRRRVDGWLSKHLGDML